MRVCVRVRPHMGGDGEEAAVRVSSDGKIRVGDAKFRYPSAIVCGSDQGTANSALAADLVESFKAGHACTLLAYGQTG